MASGNRTPFAFLHVKRHTEGTSNELSFDVLEAKKKAADAANGDAVPTSGESLGKVPLFSLGAKGKKAKTTTGAAVSAAPNPAITDPDREVSRRKGKRHRARVANVIAVIAVAAVLAGVGGSYLYRQYQANQAAGNELNQAIGLIEQTDDTIVAMDKALSSSLNDQVLSDMQTLNASMPATSSLLDRAMNEAQTAYNDAKTNQQKKMAARAIDDIEARRVLVKQGVPLMANDVAAQKAVAYMQDGWSQLLVGNKLASEAAKLIATGATENVSQSSDKSNQAIAQFQLALENVQNAVAAYPAADLTTMELYLGKRIEEQQQALASNDAILLQDKATAEARNSDSNNAAVEAAALANRMADDPAQPIYDAYDASFTEAREAYMEARATAAEADSYLGDYLGAEAK